jgi:hypothetical protein
MSKLDFENALTDCGIVMAYALAIGGVAFVFWCILKLAEIL